MKVRVIASLVMALCLAVGSASGSSIGVYFAADGSDCDATVAQNTPVTVYLLADMYADAGTGGITSAEFQVRNWPGSWFGSPTPSPAANISVGNPVGGGCNIAFPTCQPPGVNGLILLYTINAFATTAPADLRLVTDKHTTPSNPNFQCPLVTICDEVFSLLCVAGGEARINGGPCTVAVAPATWSAVKDLYSH